MRKNIRAFRLTPEPPIRRTLQVLWWAHSAPLDPVKTWGFSNNTAPRTENYTIMNPVTKRANTSKDAPNCHFTHLSAPNPALDFSGTNQWPRKSDRCLTIKGFTRINISLKRGAFNLVVPSTVRKTVLVGGGMYHSLIPTLHGGNQEATLEKTNRLF